MEWHATCRHFTPADQLMADLFISDGNGLGESSDLPRQRVRHQLKVEGPGVTEVHADPYDDHSSPECCGSHGSRISFKTEVSKKSGPSSGAFIHKAFIADTIIADAGSADEDRRWRRLSRKCRDQEAGGTYSTVGEELFASVGPSPFRDWCPCEVDNHVRIFNDSLPGARISGILFDARDIHPDDLRCDARRSRGGNQSMPVMGEGSAQCLTDQARCSSDHDIPTVISRTWR